MASKTPRLKNPDKIAEYVDIIRDRLKFALSTGPEDPIVYNALKELIQNTEDANIHQPILDHLNASATNIVEGVRSAIDDLMDDIESPRLTEDFTEDVIRALFDKGEKAYPKGSPEWKALAQLIEDANLDRIGQDALLLELQQNKGLTPEIEAILDQHTTPKALKDAATQAETDIGKAQGDKADLAEKIANNQKEIDGVENEIKKIEAEIARLENSLLSAKNPAAAIVSGTQSKISDREKDLNEAKSKLTDPTKGLKPKQADLEQKLKAATGEESAATLQKDSIERAIAYQAEGPKTHESMGAMLMQAEEWIAEKKGESPTAQEVADKVNERLANAREKENRDNAHHLFKGNKRDTLKYIGEIDPRLRHLNMEELDKASENKAELDAFLDSVKPDEKAEKMKIVVARLIYHLEAAIGDARFQGASEKKIAPMKELLDHLNKVMDDHLDELTNAHMKENNTPSGERPKVRQNLRESLRPKAADLPKVEKDTKMHPIDRAIWRPINKAGNKTRKASKAVGNKAKKAWAESSNEQKKFWGGFGMKVAGGIVGGVVGGLTCGGTLVLGAASPAIYRWAVNNETTLWEWTKGGALFCFATPLLFGKKYREWLEARMKAGWNATKNPWKVMEKGEEKTDFGKYIPESKTTPQIPSNAANDDNYKPAAANDDNSPAQAPEKAA